MTSNDTTLQNANRHVRILGICWLVYGVIRLIVALWLVSFSNTATVMFGALLSRVHDPFALMRDFHFIYTLVEVLSVVSGVLGIFAGWALLAGQGFGRTLALVAGFLSLWQIPLGMTLGIYTLVVLLPWIPVNAAASAPDHRTAGLKSHPSAT
jgi:hypothetical protein